MPYTPEELDEFVTVRRRLIVSLRREIRQLRMEQDAAYADSLNQERKGKNSWLVAYQGKVRELETGLDETLKDLKRQGELAHERALEISRLKTDLRMVDKALDGRPALSGTRMEMIYKMCSENGRILAQNNLLRAGLRRLGHYYGRGVDENGRYGQRCCGCDEPVPNHKPNCWLNKLLEEK